MAIQVADNSSKNPNVPADGKPEHWQDVAGSSFINPWPSWRTNGAVQIFKLLVQLSIQSPSPKPLAVQEKLPVRTPTWGLKNEEDKGKATNAIKTTWLGHACFLAEFPARLSTNKRGVRILFDPVFSDRCSPFSWMGPKRFTPPPCKVEEIPEIDAIVISHNHYDHMDTHTLTTLFARDHPPQIFVPLGNAPYLRSIGIPESSIHVMDWWDSKRLTIENDSLSVDVTCTPCQHMTGRSLTDRFKTLWSSWVVEEVAAPDSIQEGTPLKLFFGGDTGYRSVLDGKNEDDMPVCPVFKQIGDVFGGFEVALIPIGAYMPRQFMSPVHCAPQDSVRLFKDIKAKKAVGMHWATWVLTTEDIYEPPKRLAEECQKIGIPEGDFSVCDIGETLFFH